MVLLQEVFSEQTLGAVEQLRRADVIPQALLADYQKLLSSQIPRRLNPAKARSSEKHLHEDNISFYACCSCSTAVARIVRMAERRFLFHHHLAGGREPFLEQPAGWSGRVYGEHCRWSNNNNNNNNNTCVLPAVWCLFPTHCSALLHCPRLGSVLWFT